MQSDDAVSVTMTRRQMEATVLSLTSSLALLEPTLGRYNPVCDAMSGLHTHLTELLEHALPEAARTGDEDAVGSRDE